MQIENCLILAAGFGTRMGVIGQHLPKVLWPVFEKTLLELQVNYAKSLGIKKIYINLHFMGEQIESFCRQRESFSDVIFLWEKPEILDIGGAVHNLASQINYQGRLLILNADQFFYLSHAAFIKAIEPLQNNPVILFNYRVNSSAGYNSLEVGSDRLVTGLVKNKDLSPNAAIETYTGISIIDLSKLDKVVGKSAFFDSVAPWGKKKVAAILLESDYWDFGTVKRYWESCFRILALYRTNSNHPFLRFLVQEKALKTWKMNLQTESYHSNSPQVINLSGDDLGQLAGSMIIMNRTKPTHHSHGVWWSEYFDEVKS